MAILQFIRLIAVINAQKLLTQQEMLLIAKHNGYSPELGMFEFIALCETYGIRIIDYKILKSPMLVQYRLEWTSITIELLEKIFRRIVFTAELAQVILVDEFLITPDLSTDYFFQKTLTINFAQYFNEETSFVIRCSHFGHFTDVKPIKKICHELERKVARPVIEQTKAPIQLDNPLFQLRIMFTGEGDFVVAKRLLISVPWTEIEKRTPSKRKYFHPSAMNVPLTRAMVNLSGIRDDEYFLDPFCGTGGMLLEAADLQAYIIGLDMDRWILRGAKSNIEYFGFQKKNLGLFCGDSTQRKLRRGLIDAIATDPPYGTSSAIQGENTLELVIKIFEIANILLKPEKKIVICTPNLDFESVIPSYFQLRQTCKIRIHRSLTRKITVFQKKGL